MSSKSASESPENKGTGSTTRISGAPGVEVHDRPPQRVRDWGDVVSIVISLLLVVAVLIISINLRGTTEGVDADVKQVGSGFHWLIQLPLSLLQSLTMVAIVISVVAQLLIARMWLQAITASLGLVTGFALAYFTAFLIGAFVPSSIAVLLIPDNNVFGSSPFVLITALSVFLSAAGRRTSRKSIQWSWSALFVLAAVILVSSTITITSVLVAFGLGRAVGLGLRFGIGTQSTGVWGVGLVRALATVGFDAVSLTRTLEPDESHPVPRLDDDLSEASRLYHATTREGQHLVVSVTDEQRHTASYLLQMWRAIQFSGISTRRDRSVRETNEHHFTMLAALRALGLPTPEVLAMGAAGESAFLVYAEPSIPLSSLDLHTSTDEQMADVLRQLTAAHKRGITHRELTADSLAVDEAGAPVIVGWTHGDLASTHAHIQIDRVQIIALLATTFGIDRALTIAQSVYTDGELASIAPFAQNVAVPQHTKMSAGWNRKLLQQLRTRLDALAPSQELGGQAPVELARFNVRKFITVVLVIVAVVAVFTQLNFDEVISAIRNANPWYAVLAFLFGLISWCGSAVAFGVFIDKDMRRYDGILGTQAVASFTAVSMPASVGPIAVNLQFLHKIGYSTTRATAIATADMVAEFGTTFLLFIVIGLFTGQASFDALPGQTLMIIIGALGALVGLALLIPPARKWMRFQLIPTLRTYGHQLMELFSRPATLAVSAAGSIVQNGMLAVGFWVSMLAFGYQADFFETIFLYIIANAIGSAVPTPGGLGAVESALVVTFGGIGVPTTIALSATLLFRFATYWLRIPLGALYMRYMERHHML